MILPSNHTDIRAAIESGIPPRAGGLGHPIAPLAKVGRRQFPRNFVWGVATAAPQIEGAAWEDGKGPSIWDAFCRLPGRVHNGDTLDVACDHYHRYEEDFALMAGLGVKNYRMSIAWPRIFPSGRGVRNQKGIDFYNRLIDAAQARGITPWVTMFHWDLPQGLENEGGWRTRRVVDAFADYADTIVKAYGDRVKNWITLNEISCFTEQAYNGDEKAPGVREGQAVINQTYHHALLCHGHGVRAVREHGGRGARVGLSDNAAVTIPVTETPADIAAARAGFVTENARVLDAIYGGRYHPDYLASAGAAAPVHTAKDFELISMPADFLGLNIYTGRFVRSNAEGQPETVPFSENYPRADSPWLWLAPRSVYWGPRHVHEIYGVTSVFLTENGAGYNEVPGSDGVVLDLNRLEYVRSCLQELDRAIDDGVPVHGYFLWSFMDNFEWQDGYNRRFGIVHVDFISQKRTPKLSARWFSQVIAGHRLV
jgi:beta-glucosidase